MATRRAALATFSPTPAGRHNHGRAHDLLGLHFAQNGAILRHRGGFLYNESLANSRMMSNANAQKHSP